MIAKQRQSGSLGALEDPNTLEKQMTTLRVKLANNADKILYFDEYKYLLESTGDSNDQINLIMDYTEDLQGHIDMHTNLYPLLKPKHLITDSPDLIQNLKIS